LPVTLDVVTWKDFIDNGRIDGSTDPNYQQGQVAAGIDTNGNNALQIYNSIHGNGNFGSIPIDAQHTGNLASQVASGMTQSMYETLASHNSDTSTPLVPLAPWDMATLNPTGGTVPSGAHDPNMTPGAGGPSGSWNWVGMPGMRSVDAITI